MQLKEIEKYWLTSSNDALDTSRQLFNNKKYNHSMFFLHLSIEKMIKALYVNRNKKEAPFGHNLQILISKIQELNTPKTTLKILTMITTFNISARYDDYKSNFYKICTKNFAQKYLNKSEKIIKWLKSQMI